MPIRPLRPPLGQLILSVLVVIGAPYGPAGRWATVWSADTAGPGQPGPLILEDLPGPLVPEQPRTEADRDRLEALSLFAAGRTHQRRLEYAEALRLYQRALRRDPQAVTVAREMIPLAFYLKRPAEAARYVLKMENPEGLSRLILTRLGDYLGAEGDWEGAVKLYRAALATWSGSKTAAGEILLQRDIGRLYYLLEEYDKAADCFAQVSCALDHPEQFGLSDKIKQRLLDKPGLSYRLFGECFLQADRDEEAVAAFEKAHQVAPDKGLLEFNLAQVHARRGKPDLALASLEACFKERLASEGMAPYELLAEVLEDLGKQNELIQRLAKLRDDDPENVPLGYFLAAEYRKAEQFKEAELLYLALIKETPTLTGYRSLVEIYRKTRRPEALLAILGEATAKTDVLETLGPEAEAISDDADLMQSVVQAARKQYQAQPEGLNYDVRLAVALLALESKQSETAAEFFDLALKAKPDQAGEVLLVWGLGLLLEEQPAEAAKVFQRGIDEKALPEDDPRFHFLLAGALAMDDQTEKALAAARKAAAVKKNLPRFHSRVAWILYRAKRYDEATKAYQELIDKFDSNHESAAIRQVLREARLVLSNLCVLKEDLPEAEEWLEQVLDEFPDDVGASNDLGYLWADQGKHLQRALKMIRLAVDAEPDNVAYRDSLGWVFYRLGRYGEAVGELERAAATEDQPDAVILDHLGDAYLKANQSSKAEDAWRRAVKAFQKQEEPEKAKRVEKKISSRSHVS